MTPDVDREVNAQCRWKLFGLQPEARIEHPRDQSHPRRAAAVLLAGVEGQAVVHAGISRAQFDGNHVPFGHVVRIVGHFQRAQCAQVALLGSPPQKRGPR